MNRLLKRVFTKRNLLRAAVAGAILVVLIQFVPYGRDHANPPITAEPNWDSPRTRELAVVACFDCHSNETRYPWYSNIAPMSWLLQRDVDEGRAELNFSEFDREQEADDAAETVQEGEMPPRSYTLFHPDARLSDLERRRLIEGLLATLGGEGEGGDEDNSGPGSD